MDKIEVEKMEDGKNGNGKNTDGNYKDKKGKYRNDQNEKLKKNVGRRANGK